MDPGGYLAARRDPENYTEEWERKQYEADKNGRQEE
jgi:hypothetical protein